MKHRLGIALLFIFILGVIGFRSQAAATEYDNSEGLAQASNSCSNLLSTEPTDWEKTLVDPDGSGDVSLALDSAGIPHISYFAQEEYGQVPRAFKYATKPHDVWVTEEVIAETDLWNRYLSDQSSSVALDENDSPHIAFSLLGHNEAGEVITVTHAFKQDGYWSIGEIDATENACRHYEGDLLSDSSSALHLFYIVSDIVDGRCEFRLKYAREVEENNWQVSTLVEDNVGSFSVIIDSENVFHLAYTSYVESGSLHYSKFSSIEQFSPATIFTYSPPVNIASPSIALDKSNTPHIAFVYYEPYGYELYIAHQGTTEWIIENSEKRTGASFSDIDAFFDTQDNLHVYAGNVYGFNAVVEHYYKTQDGWQAEEIGAPAADISFVLDSSESVHGAAVNFSYGTASSWSLWYYHKLGDALTYNISGRVTTQSGTPMPGVIISTATGSSTTDADGDYTITDLPAGTYDISPTLPGYSFAPSTKSVSVPPNAASQDFVGTPDAMTDTDGDGLLDSWEINGYHHDNDGIVDVDLLAMGAALFKPDIFVEVDWMEGHKPEDDAIRRIVESFANAPVYDEAGNQIGTGINLHVDVGPDSTDWVTMKKWGSNGHGNKVDTFIETSYGNDAGLAQLSQIVRDNFRMEVRGAVFHYSLWIHKFDTLDNERGETIGYSAAHQGDYPVFLVALGSMSNNRGSPSEQATTFMHELGHNLGLTHDGDQEGLDEDKNELFNYKPNYLSVMNYSFSVTGLIIDGKDGDKCGYECFDYSRFALPALHEAELYEEVGLGSSDADRYGTKFRGSSPWLCWPYDSQKPGLFSIVKEDASGSIDWSCNGLISSDLVQEDINGRGGNTQVLTGYNDWANLDYNYAHRLVRPPLATNDSRRLSSNGFDPAVAIPELSIEEARAIPGISEVRAQITSLVTPEQVKPLDTITYTVSAYTIDFGSIPSFAPTVALPDGFTYITNSTSGDITANPTIVDNRLTWPPIEIPDNLTVREFSFQVRVGTTEGVFSTDFSGISSTNLVISDQVDVRVQREPLKRLFLPTIIR